MQRGKGSEPSPAGDEDLGLWLLRLVESTEPELGRLSDDEASQSEAPDSWCPKEILGHLVDSAINNHPRFVQAQLQDSLVFAGYAQDDWVRVQAYRDRPWAELVRLWSDLNRHLAALMDEIPPSSRDRARKEHNLHEIAWRSFSSEEPASLGDLMRDYIGHLEHHLRQILERRTLEIRVE